MGKKVAYRVGNWRKYNRSLINRGNITLWFSDDVLNSWYAKKEDKLARGRPNFYSDQCIEVALTLRSLFHFPLRTTQGFIEGLLKSLDLDLQVPHYSQLSRRAAGLAIQYYSKRSAKTLKDLVVDSTGLKIYGEGEWKVRTHGRRGRRTWRKLHVAIDPESKLTVSVALSSDKVGDGEMMVRLLKNKQNIGAIYGDGAYGSKDCFEAIVKTGAKAMIALPTTTGIAKKKKLSSGLIERNRLVEEIRAAGGRKEWKKKSGYHKRSLVEAHMRRFKKILGERLSNRKFINQFTEVQIKSLILNKMTILGMPDSYKIT